MMHTIPFGRSRQKSRISREIWAVERIYPFGAEIRCRIDPMIYGYARVSTDGQSVEAQVRQLRAAGADTVFHEVRAAAKPAAAAAVTRVGNGSTLYGKLPPRPPVERQSPAPVKERHR